MKGWGLLSPGVVWVMVMLFSFLVIQAAAADLTSGQGVEVRSVEQVWKTQAWRNRRQAKQKDHLSHRLPCSKEEDMKTACLKGECFVLDLAGMRSAFCQCPENFEGSRCEKKSASVYMYSAELKKAAIIGSTVFIVIIIIVGVSIYCSYRKGKLKRKRRLESSVAMLGMETGGDETEPMTTKEESTGWPSTRD